MQLYRPVQTRFRFGSGAEHLNLAAYHNSLARSTKSTRSLALPLLVSIRFQVLFHSPPGVLFTFPSRYCSLSVTGKYLALGGGPPCFRPDFSCPAVLWCHPWLTLHFVYRTVTLCGLPFQAGSAMQCGHPLDGPQPRIRRSGLGSSPFARRYLGNRCFFLFLRVLRCFNSPGLLRCTYAYLQCRMTAHYCGRVSPFGHLRIEGYLHLPAAYRSLSRPSSASSAKASALCSFSLDLSELPSVSNSDGLSLH
jgi:hypothetical protein